MIELKAGMKSVVVGLGKSGLAAVKYLHQQGIGLETGGHTTAFFDGSVLSSHFEKKGWAEPQVVIRFWIISIILGLMVLATLKLR
ncbi:MAG: hypothetical protein Q3M30_14000 [Candidatus Electrothrix sp. Rat3]|nr:hypothetical protein [Candidatus Electrothrix rattekaaiensis]